MKKDYWRLRARELARKVDDFRGMRAPEYVDEMLKEAVYILERSADMEEPDETTPSQGPEGQDSPAGSSPEA